MPDVLRIEHSKWTLNVWTRNVELSQNQLKRLLLDRGRQYPPHSPIGGTAFFGGVNIYIYKAKDSTLVPAIPKSLPPLFFENQSYEFEFTFVEDAYDMAILHPSSLIENAFHNRHSVLRGTIFIGNSIGWMKLKIVYSMKDSTYRDSISFMVWPTKLDLEYDIDYMGSIIDKHYPLWRFSLVQKTEHELSRSRRVHERFLLLWLAQFKSLRCELKAAIRQIIQKPCNRLISYTSPLRADRIKQRVPPRLEEKIIQGIHDGLNHKRYFVPKKTVTIDTPENRFVKMVLQSIISQLEKFQQFSLSQNVSMPGPGRLSNSFFREIESWYKPFRELMGAPLFRQVGVFDGLSSESLVLHRRAGYWIVYRVWQQLKLYLDILGQQASVSLKSVAKLYEVWCLLEIRRIIIEELGFIEGNASRARLRTGDLERSLIDGEGAAFAFHREYDNTKIFLSHEPLFNKPAKQGRPSIFSWTTIQKPDILMQIDFANGDRIRWIFDAKYRVDRTLNNSFIKDGDTSEQKDLAPEDSINQMHRYRDALILQESKFLSSRPIIGAYVLYPGWFNEAHQENPYASEIDAVGIGAFPCLPGRPNLWLTSFLKNKLKIIKDQQSNIDGYLLENAVRIPPTGLKLKRYSDLTFIANLGPQKGRDPAYFDRFLKGTAKWYHIPAMTIESRKVASLLQEISYFAPLVYDFQRQVRYLPFLYRVLEVTIISRHKINIEQSGMESTSQADYWLLELHSVQKLNLPISTSSIRMQSIFVPISRLFQASSWEMLIKNQTVYRDIVLGS